MQANATAAHLPDYVSQGEARAAAALVNDLIEAGYVLSVYDGEEYTVKRSAVGATVAAALASTGIDNLLVRDSNHFNGPDGLPVRAGVIALVWGNAPDGSELVSDWSWHDRTVAGLGFNAWMDARLDAQLDNR